MNFSTHQDTLVVDDGYDLARDSLDEDRIRTVLRCDLHATRDCRVVVIMKDNHTIRNDPRRVVRWVQIAREEAQEL